MDECPVDCIYEGARMLYIHPDECVDCGACEPVCPVEAIYYEDDLPEPLQPYIEENVKFFTDTLPGQSRPPGITGRSSETRCHRRRHPDGGGACRRRATDAHRRDHASTGDAAPPGRRDVILQLLRTSTEPRSIASVADELGVHPNTVRFHLDALVRAGRVEQVLGDSAGPGRPPILFRASRRMDPAGPTNYRLLASILTSYLAGTPRCRRLAAAELGRSMRPVTGRPSSAQRRAPSKTRAVTELVELLAELGFEPEPADGPRTREIRLRHCPFQNLAEQHGEVICSVHLGLMQGALTAMRAPVTVDRLDPFVEPDLCVAHLAPAPTRDRASS